MHNRLTLLWTILLTGMLSIGVKAQDKAPISLDALQPGDLIALLTPSALPNMVQVEKLDSGLRSWGYRTVRSEHIIDSVRTIQDRVDDMMAALRNSEVKAIYCVRGGFASTDVMDRIPIDTLRRYPKWVIGYSDVTILHSAWQTAGIPSIHASMAAVFMDLPDDCKEYTRRIIAGERPDYSFAPHPQNQMGEAEGVLIGGNLMVMMGALMSGYDATHIDEPLILMLEDGWASALELYDYLTVLNHTGVLGRVKGLMFGDFSQNKMTPADLSGLSHGGLFRDAYDIIARTMADKGLTIPIALDLPFGHGKVNYPFVLGETVHLTVSQDEVHVRYVGKGEKDE